MKQLRVQPWVALVAACGLFAGLAGCNGGGGSDTGTTGANGSSGAAATGDEVIIGLVASQNGALKPWGVDSVKGAELAVEEFNAAGGLNGKKVVLKIEDSNSNPQQGKSAAEKLMAEGAITLIGEVASGITAQMAEAAVAKGIPVVSVGATRVDITKIGTNPQMVFRVCYTDDFQGPVVAKFAYEDLGLRRVAIMTDIKQPYSIGLSDNFREYFTKLGGTIVDEQKYESEQTQFGAQLTNLKAKNPDGIFLSGYFTEVGQIARQARDAGINVPLLGGDGWDSRDLVTTGGEAILGNYYCNHYNNEEDRPEVAEFLKKFEGKYGERPATTMAALSYDATRLVLDALKRASALTPADIATALDQTVGFMGVSGEITLKDRQGDPQKRALMVEVTREGDKFVKAFEWFDAKQ
ncbi:MAG: ABC transporter substrate-binding protein [Fimbriimonadaceae bacterium]